MGKEGIKTRVLGSEKAQVTIFVIVGILVVALILFFTLLYPRITTSDFHETNPSQFIDSCLEESLMSSLERVSVQGGSIDPEHYIVYGGENIEYLCYTSEDYEKCVMQQPFLEEHVEEEVNENIKRDADNCFRQLVEEYRGAGYSVDFDEGEMSTDFLPKRVVVNFNHTLSVSKGDTDRYDSFIVVTNNNIYELVSIAKSILNWEARYGDAETTLYMNYYRDLKVEKKKQIEGSTIYIITDRNTGNKFQFASRSVALPPGYGGE